MQSDLDETNTSKLAVGEGDGSPRRRSAVWEGTLRDQDAENSPNGREFVLDGVRHDRASSPMRGYPISMQHIPQVVTEVELPPSGLTEHFAASARSTGYGSSWAPPVGMKAEQPEKPSWNIEKYFVPHKPVATTLVPAVYS